MRGDAWPGRAAQEAEAEAYRARGRRGCLDAEGPDPDDERDRMREIGMRECGGGWI